MSIIKDRSIIKGHRVLAFRGLSPAQYLVQNQPKKLTRTRVGEVNPRYEQNIRDQVNATTKMTGTFDKRDDYDAEGFAKIYYHEFAANGPIRNSWAQGDIMHFIDASDPDSWGFGLSSTKARNRALIAFLKNVRAVEVEFSSPTFLGELRETMHMIRHPLVGLGSLCKDWYQLVRKRKRDKPTKWKKDLSSLWLEQAFGWQPLIHDIDNAWKAYKGLSDGSEQRLVRGIGIEEKLINTYPTGGNVNTIYFSGNGRWTEKYFVKFQGMVKRSVKGPKVNEYATRFGFTPSEFVPTAWELLPWSFLVDYFTNIGDVLTANMAVTGSLAWTNVSTVRFQTIETACGYDESRTKISWVGSPYISGFGPALRSKRERRFVTRDIISPTEIGTPMLALELPGSPYQWANMTALFAQFAAGVHPQRSYTR